MNNNKRVYIIHKWDGAPQNCWIPWLKRELEARGFFVVTPKMPGAEKPDIQAWISHLNNVAGEVDENTFFVGHSIGCQAILRFVENFVQQPIGGIVCVAGFFRLLHLETDEEKEIAKPWLETKLDFEKIKKYANKIIAIFSDNDPDVDLGDKKLFEKYLNAITIVEHNKGHFSDDVGVKELPSALNSILELSKN